MDPDETPERLAAVCLGGAGVLDAAADLVTDPDDRARKHAAAAQVRRYAAALTSDGLMVPAAEARLVAHAAQMGGTLPHAALLTAPDAIRAAADALLASGVLTFVVEDHLIKLVALAAYAASPDQDRQS